MTSNQRTRARDGAGPSSSPEELIERVQRLTARARAGRRPGGASGERGARRLGDRALRPGPRADLRRGLGQLRRRARRQAGRRRDRRQPDADPRPLPGRPRRSGSRRRWRASARTWSRTAATSSCSASSRGSQGSSSRAAATAARPRPRRSSSPSSRRSTRRLPTSRGWSSRAPCRPHARVAATPGPGALELPVVQVASDPSPAAEPPSWFDLDDASALGEGELAAFEVRGVALVVARVEGNLLAFRDACASCGSALGSAGLDEGTLTCPSCARRFFLPRAGRSLDDERLLLAPVPLLAGAAGARVALPA